MKIFTNETQLKEKKSQSNSGVYKNRDLSYIKRKMIRNLYTSLCHIRSYWMSMVARETKLESFRKFTTVKNVIKFKK